VYERLSDEITEWISVETRLTKVNLLFSSSAMEQQTSEGGDGEFLAVGLKSQRLGAMSPSIFNCLKILDKVSQNQAYTQKYYGNLDQKLIASSKA